MNELYILTKIGDFNKYFYQMRLYNLDFVQKYFSKQTLLFYFLICRVICQNLFKLIDQEKLL